METNLASNDLAWLYIVLVS